MIIPIIYSDYIGHKLNCFCVGYVMNFLNSYLSGHLFKFKIYLSSNVEIPLVCKTSAKT